MNANTIAPIALPAIGAVVTARPWVLGREIAPTRGIMLGSFDNGIGDTYAIVWFPKMGAPVRGATVMAILPGKIENVRTLAGESKTFVLDTYRLAKAANRTGAWTWQGAGFALEAAAKARR